MARLLDYAAFAQHTYDSTNGLHRRIIGTTTIYDFDPKHPLSSGWQQVHRLSTQYARHHSFYAELFVLVQHDRAVEAVVAFRGTLITQLRNDWSDIKITTMHRLPVNFSQALAFYGHAERFLKKQYSYTVPLSVTGHSLGGMIAKLVAIKRHSKAVAFNAPGIGEEKLVNAHHDYRHQIVNINSTKGAINKIGKSIGQISYVPLQQGEHELHNIDENEAWIKQFPLQKDPWAISDLPEKMLSDLDKHHMISLLNALIHMAPNKRPTLPWRHV